ncbi:MAG TPA: hypothetical protein VID27_04280, partial [Blastocatellia bacterium]
TLEQIIAELASLEAEDFDYEKPGSDGIERLDSLMDDLLFLPQPERAIRAIFDVMERMPEVDLGSPRALVHTLESMRGQYEQELVNSIKRIPTSLSVWMINRIINSTTLPENREFWMDLLKLASEHPKTMEIVRMEAQDFIRYQNERVCEISERN